MAAPTTTRPGTLSLTADDGVIEQSSPLTFGYAVPADRADDQNWVGVYSDPGNSPVDGVSHGASTVWAYAAGTSGEVTLSSAALAPGKYLAWLLYDDGYVALADPVSFTVTPVLQLPPPEFRSAFPTTDVHGRRRTSRPAGMTIDTAGRCWVADTGAGTVQRFDARGRLRGVLGARQLVEPRDVAVIGSRVYVADSGLDRVEVFTDRGRRLGDLAAGELDGPRGITADRHGRLLVSDTGHNRVVRIDPARDRIVGAITTGLHLPHGIHIDGVRTWVVSSSRQYDGNPGITCYVDDAPTVTLGAGQHSRFGALSNPAHVTVDHRGHVLVSVPDFGYVSRYRPTGAFLGSFGAVRDDFLRQPMGVVATPDGIIHVVDAGAARVVRYGDPR